MPRTARCPAMVGDSPPMEALRRRLTRLGPLQAPVLVTGETGVGKELAARALHGQSARHGRRFVAINCAALTPQLAPSELFGAVQGAYTGARTREGLFQAADGGTLFLDEVGELDPQTQGALLRVLETGRVRKVGATAGEPVDVRLVTATHRDLKAQVIQGAFRADLYHRIAALLVEVPPLRARLADLPELAGAVAPEAAHRLTEGAWARLSAHRWPGNVRELRNVLQRAAAEHDDGPLTAASLIFDALSGQAASAETGEGPLQARIARLVQTEFKRQAGNVRQTARVLAVSPTTVYRYLQLAADGPSPD
ncbi:MAG: sigma-54-dependent Fis family transcriptional regulator [Myxococcales bacterium]|nr:sigma-54-dependent Fis family transcriptional regulator [Myxococcales bacterium]